MSACIPYGYSYDSNDVDLVVNPDEMRIINIIIRAYNNGKSVNEITKWLNTKPNEYPPNGVKWYYNTIDRIIKRYEDGIDKNDMIGIIKDVSWVGHISKEIKRLGLNGYVSVKKKHSGLVDVFNNNKKYVCIAEKLLYELCIMDDVTDVNKIHYVFELCEIK